MSTTMITVIGRGEDAVTPGADPYQRTRYTSDSSAQIATFFGQMLAQQHHPDWVEILGTTGSTWRALAYDADDLDLAEALQEAGTRLTPGLLQRLSDRLSMTWGAAVTCHLIDERDPMDLFRLAYGLIPARGACLLDLTHGYRDIPMLMIAALQVKDGFHPGVLARTQLWYGRLTERAASPPRQAQPGPDVAVGQALRLRDLERLLSLASGATAFCRSLDPGPLLAALQDPSALLRKALESLSDIVLTHDFTLLTTAPQQVLDHLGRWAHDPGDCLHAEVEALLRPMAVGGLGARLLALAEWAHRQGHHALAAQAAYESLTRLATRDSGAANDKAASEAISAFLAGKPEQIRRVLGDELRLARNRTAHGSESGGHRQRIDIPGVVSRALPALKTLRD